MVNEFYLDIWLQVGLFWVKRRAGFDHVLLLVAWLWSSQNFFIQIRENTFPIHLFPPSITPHLSIWTFIHSFLKPTPHGWKLSNGYTYSHMFCKSNPFDLLTLRMLYYFCLSASKKNYLSYICSYKRSARQMLWFSVAISHKININQKKGFHSLRFDPFDSDSYARGKARITKNST